MKAVKTMTAGLVGAAFLVTFAAQAFSAALYPSCAKGTIEEIGSGYVAPVYGAQTNWPFPTYRWVKIKCTELGDEGYSSYGVPLIKDQSDTYLIHPSWDQDGKLATLLTAKVEGKDVSFTLYRNLNVGGNAVQSAKWLMSVSMLSTP